MRDRNMESINKIEDECATQNETASAENSVYYGVYIPNDFQSVNSDSYLNVYAEKYSVMQLLKQNKRARFKAFNAYSDAVNFALTGNDNQNNNSTTESFTIQRTALDAPVLLGEKPSPFKGPKPQDLIILRKAIEKGDYNTVEEIVWRNPRYLISNGDTPSILQEGSRYNALHIAAKAKHGNIAELILNTVSNVEFVKLLYGDDNIENGQERASVFTDLYLNTPDKGLNETPLHFAVKFGAVDVVEVLVSYPQCDKTVKNKYNQTPSMMICDRCDKSDKGSYKRIAQLLEETYYVPVLRAEDNSVPPTVGEPFSPTNPPVFNTHPSSPRLEIQAYAGPMNKEGAEQFRKVWKTPPRSSRFNTSTKKLDESFDSLASLKYKDPLKGLELVGKNLAAQYEISWKEYWPFLDSFVDITSEEGLNLLENHLKSRVLDTSRSIISMSSDSIVTEKVHSSVSSISDLCQAFQAIQLNSSNSFDQSLSEIDSKHSNNFSPFLCLEKACQVLAHRFANNILNTVNGNLINILDAEIKQLEVVILSYMADDRFSSINFSCVHCRLSYLVAQKLYFKFDKDSERIDVCQKIETLIEICSNSFDCFSSDDEGVNSKDILAERKGTSIRKQLLCLAHSIESLFNQNLETNCDNLTEQDCIRIWENLTPCACILYARKSRRNSTLQRNNSRKYNLESLTDSVRKPLGESLEGIDILDSDSNESYFTPDVTPYWSEDEGEDEFDDARTEDPYDVFIEGPLPGKTDDAVFNALKYAGYDVDIDKYPNIYLWRHKVSQYPEEVRKSWRKQKNAEYFTPSPPSNTSTPQKASLSFTSTPSKSWLRITGFNSPKKPRKFSILNGI